LLNEMPLPFILFFALLDTSAKRRGRRGKKKGKKERRPLTFLFQRREEGRGKEKGALICLHLSPSLTSKRKGRKGGGRAETKGKRGAAFPYPSHGKGVKEKGRPFRPISPSPPSRGKNFLRRSIRINGHEKRGEKEKRSSCDPELHHLVLHHLEGWREGREKEHRKKGRPTPHGKDPV